MDKSVLEALACGVPVLSSSEAFETILSPEGLFLSTKNPEEIASSIIENRSRIDAKRDMYATHFREYVAREHGLATTLARIVAIISHH
jgi:glycosyltransferase involved in cell wall biosynthesis